ncbi:MAG: DUF5906 domain-containing protein [Bacteroidota bacterium]|jgi:predicted transcriptional regulator|nr:DUF5906 domain-containing protein [Bacteroidota bacterium]
MSVKAFTLDDADNKYFESTEIPIDELSGTFTNHNFSTIEWENGRRLKDKFLSASGIMVDIDEDITIDAAVEVLDNLGIIYFLVTSKGHKEWHHKLHIIIPTDRKIVSPDEYDATVIGFCEKHFPVYDKNAMNGARYFTGSPSNAFYKANPTGLRLSVDEYSVEQRMTINLKALNTDFPATKTVILADGQEVMVSEINVKTPIICPYHDDTNASAFVSYHPTEFKHYIRCSTCGKTWFEQTTDVILEKKCGNFFSLGPKVYEAGILGDHFSFQDVGKEKFFIRTRTKGKEKQEVLYDYLVRERHFHSVTNVDVSASADYEESDFDILWKRGEIKVKIAARRPDVQDNALLESCLDQWFGDRKSVIKQWMALYAYTNFKQLPTLILIGERGTGKTQFAEMVGEIFPSLSLPPDDLKSQFNQYALMKLIYIDEMTRDGKLEYELLKKLSGSGYVDVNIKHIPQHKRRSNLNLILMSNNLTPIFVRRGEEPKDESNNQFFVHKFSKLNVQIDPDLAEKLRERIGHYVRSELREIYESVKNDTMGKRYSMLVPITEEEKALFANNTTELESKTDRIINATVDAVLDENKDDFYGHIMKGYLPHEFIENQVDRSRSRATSIIQELRERGYLTYAETRRITVDCRRAMSYTMTDTFKQEVLDAKLNYDPFGD